MEIDNGDPEHSINKDDEESIINDGTDDKLDVAREVIYKTFCFNKIKL